MRVCDEEIRIVAAVRLPLGPPRDASVAVLLAIVLQALEHAALDALVAQGLPGKRVRTLSAVEEEGCTT